MYWLERRKLADKIRAMVEATLNTQLALWRKKSIVRLCLAVGYGTWKASEDSGSLLNTIQLISLLVGKYHKSAGVM